MAYPTARILAPPCASQGRAHCLGDDSGREQVGDQMRGVLELVVGRALCHGLRGLLKPHRRDPPSLGRCGSSGPRSSSSLPSAVTGSSINFLKVIPVASLRLRGKGSGDERSDR